MAHHLQQRLRGQRPLHVERSRIRPRHLAWHGQHQPVGQQPVLPQLWRLRPSHKAYLQPPRQQQIVLDGGGHVLQVHHHIGGLLLEAGHQGGGQCEARQPEPYLEAPGGATRQRQGVVLESLAVFHQGAGLGQQLGADGGQLGAVATPVEQGAAERQLQPLDLLGQRRLRDEEPTGGLPVVGGLGQHDEGLQLS
ncbi:hypothetical protein D3C80_954620 [compost metagenome]